MEIKSIDLSIKSSNGQIIESHRSNKTTVLEGMSLVDDYENAWLHMMDEGEIQFSEPKMIEIKSICDKAIQNNLTCDFTFNVSDTNNKNYFIEFVIVCS